MSKHHLREEKNCLNCGNTVDQRFCGNCGQENTEPRQTFAHLVAHFFEDLTHYEGKFWGTLRYLFFRPALLTKEFLEGKRNKYLPPVRLYIFASFITFFLPAIIPGPPNQQSEDEDLHELAMAQVDSLDDTINEEVYSTKDSAQTDSALQQVLKQHSKLQHKSHLGYTATHGFQLPTDFDSKHELDSVRNALKGTDASMNYLEYAYNKKAIELKHNKYPPKEQLKMFWDSLKHNFPKALFLYMPLFAFTLRLFHKRKNWIYFDHGIFTLHLFSFMLLTFLGVLMLSNIDDWISYLFHWEVSRYFFNIIIIGTFLWFPYYLFRAHKKMYEESRFVSALKTWAILILNSVLFFLVFVTLALYTLFTMH